MSAPGVATITKRPEGPLAPRSSLFLSPEKRTLPMALLLIAFVVVAYSPVAHNGFLNFDDGTYIATNQHIKAGLTAQTVKWAFTTFEGAHYHPLTWLTHALDCQLFGMDPAAHHEVNVLLHAANAVLLFLLLRAATGFPWRSLFVAALFALHPINVESVAWAAERKNVLSMLFLLLAFHAYVAYVRQPEAAAMPSSRFCSQWACSAKSQVSHPSVSASAVRLLASPPPRRRTRQRSDRPARRRSRRLNGAAYLALHSDGSSSKNSRCSRSPPPAQPSR